MHARGPPMRGSPVTDVADINFLTMLSSGTTISWYGGASRLHASSPACFLLAFHTLRIAILNGSSPLG